MWKVKAASKVLNRAMQNDPELVWGWHCNIAMAAYVEDGITHEKSNRIAARVMRICFDVDTTTHPSYRRFDFGGRKEEEVNFG